MKVASKPISSPSRTEKFPPPLMRFLRSNVGSKSRGRSRSSPMFVRRKNAAAIETQEPSSPKVTCIGQVRVRRSSKPSSGRSRPPAKHRPCWWFRRTLLYTKRLKQPGSYFRPAWRKWASLFRFGYCRKTNTGDDSSKVESNRRGEYKGTETDDKDGTDGSSKATEVFKSPPKNALILTRCRSAPYRSSSLGNRFWGSPVASSETGNVGDEENEQEEREIERPMSENEGNSTPESRTGEGNSEISKQLEGSINGRSSEDGLKGIEGGEALPLILTRCKSEPARTGERLNPDIQFPETNKVGFC